MPATAQIIYQPYVPGARGALKPGTPVVCHTAERGVRRAEKTLAGGSIVGARTVRPGAGNGTAIKASQGIAPWVG